MSFDWSQYFDVSRELADQARNAPAPLQYDLNHPVLNNLPFTTQAALRWAREALARLQRLQRN